MERETCAMERFGPQDGTVVGSHFHQKKQVERAIGRVFVSGRSWNGHLAQWNDLARKENGDDQLYYG